MRKYLKDQYNIVVDRCNFDVSQRKTWIGIANEFNVPVDCLVFTADQQVRLAPNTRWEGGTNEVGYL